MKRQTSKQRHSVNYWIHALASSLGKGASRYYGAHFGVTLPEMRILSTLHSHGDMAPRDLCTLTAMDKGMVSRVLSRLSQDGYVELLDDGNRTRMRRWSLTATGRSLVGRLQPVWLKREAIIQASLSEAEHDQLVDILERLFWASEELRNEEQAGLETSPETAPKRSADR